MVWETRDSTTRFVGAESRCLFRPCLVHKKPKTFQDFPSYQILRLMHGALNIDKKKLITQFACKSRAFKPSYSMIEQCLSNKNESATMSKSKKIWI